MTVLNIDCQNSVVVEKLVECVIAGARVPKPDVENLLREALGEEGC